MKISQSRQNKPEQAGQTTHSQERSWSITIVCGLSQLLHASRSDSYSSCAIVWFTLVIIRRWSITGSIWVLCYSVQPRNSPMGTKGSSFVDVWLVCESFAELTR